VSPYLPKPARLRGWCLPPIESGHAALAVPPKPCLATVLDRKLARIPISALLTSSDGLAKFEIAAVCGIGRVPCLCPSAVVFGINRSTAVIGLESALQRANRAFKTVGGKSGVATTQPSWGILSDGAHEIGRPSPRLSWLRGHSLALCSRTLAIRVCDQDAARYFRLSCDGLGETDLSFVPTFESRQEGVLGDVPGPTVPSVSVRRTTRAEPC
jgi:hypothetical protein